ncbi:YecA family protein [Pseudomonas caricapapayae]|uniref:SecA translocase subunit n=1 Tax=Pseudomonas caricapapayae TaxID=46678 RepID=A0A3M3BAY7_9PSED|nr:YecA family protein [Pseudomonas caricapapayae]KAA8686811.1 UPF0149 family protein [Pseudomonas caricapapayae]RMM09871.1 hypothetical protein ALQ84_200164 [Pseudomonas caricapapayae]
MSHPPFQQALTEAELDRLTGFLDAIGSPAMNIEMLDGYFAALICGPEMVPPSEYLPQILGENFSFESNAQATDMMGLIMRHWNTIASVLLHTLEEPDVYLPVLLEDDDGITYGNDWALGFMRGVQARPGSWRDLIDSDEHSGPMLPIMLLAYENDPDPALRPPSVTNEEREDVIEMMIASLTIIYRFFEPHRWSLALTPPDVPLRREGPKIGRNAPCPCSSGRKFKHCCGSNSPTVH